MVALLRVTFGGPGDADLAGVLVFAVAYIGTLIVLGRRRPFNYGLVTLIDALIMVLGILVMSLDARNPSRPLGSSMASVILVGIAWVIAVVVLYIFLRAMNQWYERNGRR